MSPEVLKVLYRLHRTGHLAYLCGGGVRDLLLGRKIDDFDVATDAEPRSLKKVFGNCRLIGRRFRIAHIMFKGGKIHRGLHLPQKREKRRKQQTTVIAS